MLGVGVAHRPQAGEVLPLPLGEVLQAGPQAGEVITGGLGRVGDGLGAVADHPVLADLGEDVLLELDHPQLGAVDGGEERVGLRLDVAALGGRGRELLGGLGRTALAGRAGLADPDEHEPAQHQDERQHAEHDPHDEARATARWRRRLPRGPPVAAVHGPPPVHRVGVGWRPRRVGGRGVRRWRGPRSRRRRRRRRWRVVLAARATRRIPPRRLVAHAASCWTGQGTGGGRRAAIARAPPARPATVRTSRPGSPRRAGAGGWQRCGPRPGPPAR